MANIWLAASVSIASLALTGSKWPWHFGVYAIPATILAAIFVAQVAQKKLAYRGFLYLFTGPLLLFVLGSSTSQMGSWGAYDHANISWNEFVSQYNATVHNKYWTIGITSVFLVTLLSSSAKLYRPIKIMPWMVSLIVITPTLATFIWVVTDTKHQYNWTLARQNIQQLKGEKNCGAFSDLGIIDTVAEIRPNAQTFSRVIELPEYNFDDKLVYKPFTNSTVYGIARSVENKPAFQDAENFIQEEYLVPTSGKFSIWANGSNGNNQTLFLTVFDASGAEISKQTIERVGAGTTWMENEFLIDSKGSKFTISTLGDAKQNEDEWILFTRPAIVNSIAAKELLQSKTSFAGPTELTRYPCLVLPATTFGVWPKFDYVIKGAFLWDFNGLSSRSLIEVGCSKYSGTCIYKLNYPLVKNMDHTFVKGN